MRTVISAFDDRQTAQRAVDRLIESGFSREDVHLQPGAEASTSASTETRTDRDEGGFLASVGNFFANLFGTDTPTGDAGTYSEAVRRGSTVVVVDVADDEEAERASDVMDELGTVDIDERATQWKTAGWSGFDASAKPLTPLIREESGASSETVMNVVQEELKVGKRSVDRGGVRVIQRVTETPVRELVKLREERATVERRPVDRPASEADFANFKEGTIEVRETSEEAVVEKTARVVEEVVVGKEVQERTETVSDTVRRKDVEVERVEGQPGVDVVAGDTVRRTDVEVGRVAGQPGVDVVGSDSVKKSSEKFVGLRDAKNDLIDDRKP